MSQAMFEYKLVVFPSGITPLHEALAFATDRKTLVEWSDKQSKELSRLMTTEYADWEIVSHDIFYGAGAPEFSILLRRPVQSA